jgi:cell division septation protein DedD
MRDYAKINLKLERHKQRRRSLMLSLGMVTLAVCIFTLGFFVGQKIESFEGLTLYGESAVLPTTEVRTLSDSSPSKVSTAKAPAKGKNSAPPKQSTSSLGKESASQPSESARKLSAASASSDSGEGTAPQSALISANQVIASESPTSTARNYTLQIAAFREKERAQRLMQTLEEKGYKPYIVSTDNSRNESWHLVRIGHFPSAEIAQQFAQSLQTKEKMSALVWKVNP